MTDTQYTTLVKAVLGYAGLKMAYTTQGVSVEEGANLNAALAECIPDGYAERRAK